MKNKLSIFIVILFTLVLFPSVSAILGCTGGGDLATTCYLNTTYVASNNEFINANNLVIQDAGVIFNNNTINVTVNLTGDLTVIGKINVSGYAHATAPKAGSNLFIVANVLNLTSTGLILSEGGKITGGAGYGAAGGTLNFSLNTFYLNGNISVDGGDYVGGVANGNGGDAGNIYFNVNDNLNLQGNIFGRGGTGYFGACVAGSTGNRGRGATMIFNNSNYNLTINGTVDLHMGEMGMCNNDLWGSSLIKASNFFAGHRANISLNGIINLTNNLEVNGEFNLLYAIKNNPAQTAGITLIAGFVGITSTLFIRYRLLKKKLSMLIEEEALLLELMKMVQRQCFSENRMSMEEYEQAMSQYESKLSETVEDKIRTETKIANLLRIRGKKKALDQEKTRLIELIRKAQDDYLNKNKIETRIYEGMVKSYSSRLSEVDEQLAYGEAQDALKKQSKINNMFKI